MQYKGESAQCQLDCAQVAFFIQLLQGEFTVFIDNEARPLIECANQFAGGNHQPHIVGVLMVERLSPRTPGGGIDGHHHVQPQAASLLGQTGMPHKSDRGLPPCAYAEVFGVGHRLAPVWVGRSAAKAYLGAFQVNAHHIQLQQPGFLQSQTGMLYAWI